MTDPTLQRVLDRMFEAQERLREADRAIHEATETILDAYGPHLTETQLDAMWGKIRAKMVEEGVVLDAEIVAISDSAPKVKQPGVTHAYEPPDNASLRDEPPSLPLPPAAA